MNRTITIGTRGSDLALWQANHVKDRLTQLGAKVELKIIKTQGDRIQHLSFDKMEGKGFFTKEIEEHLLNGSIDLAVHSHKDLETTEPEGLTIAAVSERANPSDLLLIRKSCLDQERHLKLKERAVVGTSSARRKSQMLFHRPDIKLKDLRGNVPTRINKLREGQYDAILVAAAGVERLDHNIDEFEVIQLDPREFIPAPAQGVLGLQVREDDQELKELLGTLNDNSVAKRISVEREVLRLFEGGCQMPLGVFCLEEEGKYKVWAAKADSWEDVVHKGYYESKRIDGLAEKIIKDLKSSPSKRIYISRERAKVSKLFNALTNRGLSVMGKSLIKLEPRPKTELPSSDWIFFSSGNAVRIFADVYGLDHDVRYGCVGKATAKKLRSHGVDPDFVGHGGDTALIGEDLSEHIGRNAKVLFPASSSSYKKVQAGLPEDQVVNFELYDTVETPAGVEQFDVYVFTSPANFKSFNKANNIPQQARIIAMGKTTQEVILDLTGKKAETPQTPSERAVIDLILKKSY